VLLAVSTVSLYFPALIGAWLYTARYKKQLCGPDAALGKSLHPRVAQALEQLGSEWFVTGRTFVELPWLLQLRARGDGSSLLAVQVGGGAHGGGGLMNALKRFKNLTDRNKFFAAADLSFMTTMDVVRALQPEMQAQGGPAQSTPFPVEYESLTASAA